VVPAGLAKHGPPLKAGTLVCGRYEIERFLGRGGMGSVYAVHHVNDVGETLALKALHPTLATNAQAVERFRTEARAPVWIGTDNVVRIVDTDVSPELGGLPIMVMEMLTGHDLDTEVKRRGALPADEVVLYLQQVARTLDRAHSLGIIHRDLKPANLYLTRRDDGTPLVKILDFGIAKLTDGSARRLTQDGVIFGTPWYMSPEQASGKSSTAGPSVDRWALGLITYRLLTGEIYWTAKSMGVLIGQLFTEPMPPPSQRAPQLGPRFDEWFATACNRDPEKRFPSATEQVDRLAEALGVAIGTTAATPVDASAGQLPEGASLSGTPGAGVSIAGGAAAPSVSLTEASPGSAALPTPASNGAEGAAPHPTFLPAPKPSNALTIAAFSLGAALIASAAATAWLYFEHRPPATDVIAPLPSTLPEAPPGPMSAPAAMITSVAPIATTEAPEHGPGQGALPSASAVAPAASAALQAASAPLTASALPQKPLATTIAPQPPK
jgi:serine/threonine-protein kinase